MITFEEARTIVGESFASEWSEEDDFVVAPWGGETDSIYLVLAGPSRWILPPRTAPRPYNDEIITVDKETGEIVIANRPFLNATACGEPHPDDV